MAKRDDDDFDADDAAEEAIADDADAESLYDDEPEEEETPGLTPRVTKLTLVLCFLNVLAALGFVFLLMLDFEKRQGFTYAGAQSELILDGLGTKEDTQGVTAALETMPRSKLSSDALKNEFRQRGGTASVNEPFSAVEGGLRYQLYSGEFSLDDIRKSISDLGDPVGSIEEEMARLKKAIPSDVQAAAAQLKTNLQKATDAAKQDKVLALLFPLCVNPMQVESLERKLKGTSHKPMVGAALDKLLEDALQRRILADILMPVELFRAADPNPSTEKASDTTAKGAQLYPQGVVKYHSVLEDAADWEEVPLDKLYDLLNRRLDAAASATHDGSVHFGKEWDGQKRWSIEKRQNAAFLLISLAYARKHLDSKAKLEGQLLYPKGLERAQRLSGLFDFATACRAYNDAVRKLDERVREAIALDRDGFHTQVNNEVRRSEGFADKYAALQVRIRETQLQIRQAEKKLEDLRQQRDRAAKLVEERDKQKTEVQSRIVQERAVTAKRVAELRQLQQELHRALVELADAAETNARLEQRLRQLSGAKGAQP